MSFRCWCLITGGVSTSWQRQRSHQKKWSVGFRGHCWGRWNIPSIRLSFRLCMYARMYLSLFLRKYGCIFNAYVCFPFSDLSSLSMDVWIYFQCLSVCIFLSPICHFSTDLQLSKQADRRTVMWKTKSFRQKPHRKERKKKGCRSNHLWQKVISSCDIQQKSRTFPDGIPASVTDWTDKRHNYSP